MSEQNDNVQEQPDEVVVDAAAQDPSAQVKPSTQEPKHFSAEQVGTGVVNFATDAFYAAAGVAGRISERAKAFYEEQARQYAQAHPEENPEQGKAFLGQMSAKLNQFVDDVAKLFKDLAEEGRTNAQGQRNPDASTQPTEGGEVSTTEPGRGVS